MTIQRFLWIAALCATGVMVIARPAQALDQPVCTPVWSKDMAANNTALQNAIDTCSAKGTRDLPGLVDLAPTDQVTTAQIRSVTLKSNIVLKVESGFTLLGPSPQDVGYTGTGTTTPPLMLAGTGLTNVTITGTGTIDGNGQGFWDIFNKGGAFSNQSRPGKLVDLTGSGLRVGANFDNLGQNIAGVVFPNPGNRTVRALTIRNAPQVHLEFESGSSDGVIDGIWIHASPDRANLGTGTMKNIAPNTDGIDLVGVNPDMAKFVLVQNCVIDTGDDNIALKSNKDNAPLTNVVIRNCVFGGGHGLSVGGQETGGVFNINVSNVYFNGTDFGLKVKTDNTAKDTGVTSGGTYRNVCMQNVAEPIQLTFRYAIPTGPGGANPVIENLSFDNIIAKNTSSATQQKVLLGEITGLDPSVSPYSPLALIDKNITITNSLITGPDNQSITPFTITDGALALGTNSNIATAVKLNGSLSLITDSGPSFQCPDDIKIPEIGRAHV